MSRNGWKTVSVRAAYYEELQISSQKSGIPVNRIVEMAVDSLYESEKFKKIMELMERAPGAEDKDEEDSD